VDSLKLNVGTTSQLGDSIALNFEANWVVNLFNRRFRNKLLILELWLCGIASRNISLISEHIRRYENGVLVNFPYCADMSSWIGIYRSGIYVEVTLTIHRGGSVWSRYIINTLPTNKGTPRTNLLASLRHPKKWILKKDELFYFQSEMWPPLHDDNIPLLFAIYKEWNEFYSNYKSYKIFLKI
jgi:hypothetical protein